MSIGRLPAILEIRINKHSHNKTKQPEMEESAIDTDTTFFCLGYMYLYILAQYRLGRQPPILTNISILYKQNKIPPQVVLKSGRCLGNEQTYIHWRPHMLRCVCTVRHIEPPTSLYTSFHKCVFFSVRFGHYRSQSDSDTIGGRYTIYNGLKEMCIPSGYRLLKSAWHIRSAR